MFLTDEEQRMLNGEHGYLVQKSMEILTTLGEIYGADRMLEIKNVHSPGVSYRVAGDAGLNYVKEASEQGVFKVLTTLNTVGIDTINSDDLGFPKEFSIKQMELLDAYKKMGAVSTYTCTPYLVSEIPKFGEHVAWGESSAIVYVNSVIGARTNREGGPSALAAAVTGRVPNYGLHLDDERKGAILIKVEKELCTDTDFAVLGYHVGKIVGNRIPVFDGINKKPTLENLKALGAALATSGGVALFHILNYTPEALYNNNKILIDDYNETNFTSNNFKETKERFTLEESADLIVFGCPHTSLNEFEEIARLLDGKKIKSDMWICTSRYIKERASERGFVKIIEDAGARIICDTCPILCPTSDKGYQMIATNSAKMAHYAPGLWNVKTGLLDIEDCIKMSISGKI